MQCTFQVNRKLTEYDQRLNEVLGGAANTRDKPSGSSSSTSNKWGREDSSQQFYVTHGLPTPAMSPAVFVPTNIVSIYLPWHLFLSSWLLVMAE